MSLQKRNNFYAFVTGASDAFSARRYTALLTKAILSARLSVCPVDILVNHA